WDEEENVYTQQDYLPKAIHDVQISSAGSDGRRLMMVLGSQTTCGGAFKDLYVRAWRMDADYHTERVVDWKAHGNDGYPPLQGRVRPGDLLFEFTAGGLLSGEVHTAIRHFTFDGSKAVQLDPIAALPRDFVVE